MSKTVEVSLCPDDIVQCEWGRVERSHQWIAADSVKPLLFAPYDEIQRLIEDGPETFNAVWEGQPVVSTQTVKRQNDRLFFRVDGEGFPSMTWELFEARWPDGTVAGYIGRWPD